MSEIRVGSMNQTKLQAVKSIILASDKFKNYSVVSINVAVEEFGHPKTIEQTIAGAKERAVAAYKEGALSVGIESGLMSAPHTNSGYLETTACVLYDGKKYATGLSPSFEWPHGMTEMILNGLDGSQAFKVMGLTKDEKIGTNKGAIHVLSGGKIDRTTLNELSILMALVQLENPTIY